MKYTFGLLVVFLTTFAFMTNSQAAVQAFNSSNTNLGLFTQVKCSTGLTCTKVAGKLNIVSSPTMAGTLTVTGANAADVGFVLQADNSDDSGDDWKITALASGNSLSFLNDTSGSYVSKFSLGTTGVITLSNLDTLSNATDDSLIFASEDEHANVRVTGYDAKDASIQLYADRGDDNGDKFGLKYSAAGALTFEVNASAIATMTGSTGALAMIGGLSGDGGDTLVGFLSAQVATTTASLSAAQCGSTVISNSADVMTLPEASTVLGCRYTIVCGTADDLDINPADGSDAFGPINSVASGTGAAIAPAGGDAIRCTDIGSSITIEAVGANLWSAIGVANGPWTDVN